MRCAAVLNIQWKHQQPWIKACENTATHLCNAVPLCGTHINHPPTHVLQSFGEIVTTEEIL
jgi:hypothetical protein